MSEKATLLTSIPPVSKSGGEEKSTLLSPKNPGSGSSEVQSSSSTANQSLTATKLEKASDLTSSAGDSGLLAGSETQAVEQEATTITAFQGIIYGSFVLTFCLAGFASVVLFRKAKKIAETRFVVSARAMAGVCGLFCGYGFFVTYLFANYLNGSTSQAPVLPSILIWVVVGPAVGYILNELLTPAKRPEKGSIIFDGVAYALIFGLAAFSTMPGIKANAALIFSLAAGFIFIVPVARMFTSFRTAKARHPELRELSDQVLIYSLIIGPGLVPVIAFAHVCGLGKDGGNLTMFLLNFVLFDFLLVASLAMIASADEFVPEIEQDSAVADPSKAASAVSRNSDTALQGEVRNQPQTESPSPASVVQRSPKKLPPRPHSQPSTEKARPSAPKRPGVSHVSEKPAPSAPNAPSRLKAPSKPKKRF